MRTQLIFRTGAVALALATTALGGAVFVSGETFDSRDTRAAGETGAQMWQQLQQEASSSPYRYIRDHFGQLRNEHAFGRLLSGIQYAFRTGALSEDKCHVLVHQAGHYAYLTHGSNYDAALSYLDSPMCTGAYVHGIVAEVVLSGFDIRRELRTLCREANEAGLVIGPCFHGAGHSYVDLNKDVGAALRFCDALVAGTNASAENCYRGVFSEFGYAAIGIDGHTGRPIGKAKPYADIDTSEPYRFCRTRVPEQYRPQCYSQLIAKFHFDPDNLADSIEVCRSDAYTRTARRKCVSVMVANGTRHALSHASSTQLPQMVNDLPTYLQRAAVAGAKDTMLGFRGNGVEKQWQPLCEAFKAASIRRMCRTELSSPH